MRGRSTSIRFNFDSLTDTVTNLSGTLILIVVLVLGLTREMLPTIISPPPPEPSKEAGGKPIAPLLWEIEQLKLQIRAVDEQIRNLETVLPELQQTVEELRRKAPSPQSRNRVAVSERHFSRSRGASL
jgi:hypothetical protein